jgi:hypothetical protein
MPKADIIFGFLKNIRGDSNVEIKTVQMGKKILKINDLIWVDKNLDFFIFF